MTGDLFAQTGLEGVVQALERDLRAPDGPRISTMRNHNFAIVVYPPKKEFQLRRLIHQMVAGLRDDGWAVDDIALHKLLLDRLRQKLGETELQTLVERERRVYGRSPERAMNDLKHLLSQHIDGEDGLAADLEARLRSFRKEHPVDPDRTLVLLGRAGALYPFFRSSALLKHLGGRTEKVPVVLLYPGELRDGRLSFMEELVPDGDYRPRIYA